MSRRRRLARVHRTPLTPDAIRAGYGAHRLEHGGTVGRGCRTCRRYLAAIARALERDAVRTAELAAQPSSPPAADRVPR